MSKHTLGPWEVSKHATPAYAPQFGVYAPGRNDHVIVKGDNAAIDARLIASAPALLAALEEARNFIADRADECDEDEDHLIKLCDEAIAQATEAA